MTFEQGKDEIAKAEFLKEIEGWRESLACNLARRNPALSHEDLNQAVQLTIQRIIFLRMAEERGIEPYERLLKLTERPNIYQRFINGVCRTADNKYHSGLFHFDQEAGVESEPDNLTPRLVVDDKVLKSILANLYIPSPDAFRRVPVEILGDIYEQFLGKVIRLTKDRQAKVEEKNEVRKAGGVYYTPPYIVDYILKNTVGMLIDGKSPAQLAGKGDRRPFRLLDMACGSGSFLLGGYQYLLNYCLKWYVENGPEKHKKAVWQPNGQRAWRLTSGERKRILATHVFGVDIDAQAVEVSKLTLLLKVLEAESDESPGKQTQLQPFHDRALPNLARNIQCGNALVGADYSTGQGMAADKAELGLVKPFDWKTAFPEIMNSGGFDCVIGNPPYIDAEWMTRHLKGTRDYCVPRYTAACGNWDIFCVFAEKALRLCRDGGRTGLIVPNKIGSANYAAGARRVLASENRLINIRDYSHVPVFPIAVYPIVFVSAKEKPEPTELTVAYERMRTTEMGKIVCLSRRDLPYSRFFAHPEDPWEVFSDAHDSGIIEKMRALPTLDSVATVLGAATVSEAYEIQHLISSGGAQHRGTLRVVNSGTIDRYHDLWANKELRYLGKSYAKPIVAGRNVKQLPPKRRLQAFTPKIVIAGMTKHLECMADLHGEVLAAKSTSIVLSQVDLRFLLGVLNSKAASFFYSSVFGGNKLQGGYLRIGPPQLRKVPVPVIDVSGASSKKSQHDRILVLVEEMLDFHESLGAAVSEQRRRVLQRQIQAQDAEIDRLVHDLYGLTEEEIAIVEQNALKWFSAKGAEKSSKRR